MRPRARTPWAGWGGGGRGEEEIFLDGDRGRLPGMVEARAEGYRIRFPDAAADAALRTRA